MSARIGRENFSNLDSEYGQTRYPLRTLGVRQGWRLIHGDPELLKPKALEAEGDRFRPYRSIVALLCWHAVHVERGQGPV